MKNYTETLNKFLNKFGNTLSKWLKPNVTYKWNGVDYDSLEKLPKDVQERFLKFKKFIDEMDKI